METVKCNDCGDELELFEYRDDGTIVCADCYDEYTHCEACGVEIHHEDAYPLADESAPEGCESYGCNTCAGYTRWTLAGWQKE